MFIYIYYVWIYSWWVRVDMVAKVIIECSVTDLWGVPVQRNLFWVWLNQNKFGFKFHIFSIDVTPNGILFGAKSIENCTFNPNLFWFNKIQKIFLCVYLAIHYLIITMWNLFMELPLKIIKYFIHILILKLSSICPNFKLGKLGNIVMYTVHTNIDFNMYINDIVLQIQNKQSSMHVQCCS